MKRTLCVVVALTAASLSIMAQNLKSFTLDDLIPGGTTYSKMQPARRAYAWWGEQLIHLTSKSAEGLFALDDINAILTKEGRPAVKSLSKATFPYPDRTLVRLDYDAGMVLVDWKEGKVWGYYGWKEMSEFTAFAPATGRMAYSVGHNLYIATKDGKVTAVSTDGSTDLVYGESVHRNEFGIETGVFWNPAGDRLAFYRMDQSMVSTYPQVRIEPGLTDTGKSRCAVMEPDKYPMAGEASHKVTVGVFDTSTGKTIYLDAGDPTDRYFTNVQWSPDGRFIYMIELNRDQNHAQMVRYDAVSGNRLTVLFEETDDKYVEPVMPIQFLPWDSSKFIHASRKDGWLHLYLYDTDGKMIRQLTKGEFEVVDLLGFDPAAKSVIYTSNEANTIGLNTYSVDMKGRRTLLDNGEGWHKVLLSPSGREMVDECSSPTIARRQELRSTELKGKGRKEAELLYDAPDPWKGYDVPEMKIGTLKAADGVTDLYYRLILPKDFDPEKKYPAVIYVYGGPHAHNVDASRGWGVRGWDIWMAQQGYVMFCMDNRGSEHRGKAFEQATFRQLGVEEMKDQMKGVDFLKSLDYVDAGRIGVHGWSFGGFMTTSLMTTYPDTFKAGVAGGPVIDWKFYEVMYGERYMDTPQTNPDGYASTSLLGKAKNLKGRLLVIYGANDPTCVPQHTLSFLRACIDAGTYPDLFTYPGQEHNMRNHDRIHLHHKITQYFNDFLK